MFRDSSIYDICVIGSGAGGAGLAHRLASRGRRVIILERGANLPAATIRKDELSICRQNAFRPTGQAGLRELFYDSDKAIVANHLWTATGVGGGTRIMSGFFLRMKPEDFRPRTNFGNAAGATHCNWPITYDDLKPYYEEVESFVGVSGSRSGAPDRNRSYPLPPLKAHPVTSIIDRACVELGYTPLDTPRAVLSEKRGERGECSYSGFCGSYACLTGAKGSTTETYIREAVNRLAVTLLCNHYVYKLESESDRITAALCFNQDNIPLKIRARIFVVACSAIESARLLLNSATRTFPAGLANSSGQVGKNLTFQMPCDVTAFFDKKLFPGPAEAPSPFVQRCLQDFHRLSDDSLTYQRGGSVIFLFPHPNPIQRVLSLSYRPDGTRIIGTQLQRLIRDYFSYNHLQTDTFIDFLPNEKTAVTLSTTVVDSHGIPVAAVRFCPHSQSRIAARVLGRRLTAFFSQMGAEAVSINPSFFTAGEIQSGTCRFGDDPTISVLNPMCRSHDHKNLYVTDGSFFPSGLPVPSTLTIMANSLRVADFIDKKG
ncbi:MAG: GMC family oxidoreductase [Chitinivibrionales bacterium]|nr:GMC family oxidoreductase [Chitinivibrionales bacterium]